MTRGQGWKGASAPGILAAKTASLRLKLLKVCVDEECEIERRAPRRSYVQTLIEPYEYSYRSEMSSHLATPRCRKAP